MSGDLPGSGAGAGPRGGIGALAAFGELPDSVRARLDAIRRLRSFEPGQLVVPEGEPQADIGVVESGILRMQKNLATGRQHIVGLLVSGDMFGRVFDGPLNFDIEAATAARVWSFPRAPFEALVEQAPELERMVLLNLLNELDRARDWMMILGNRRITGRVAGFLLVLCTRVIGAETLRRTGGGAIEVKVPISRADMAHLLGTRQESLSRAIHALANDGIIRIRTPRILEILDLAALVAESGEEGEGMIEFDTIRDLLDGRDG